MKKWYREGKGDRTIVEVTEDEVIRKLEGYYENPTLAMYYATKERPVQTSFAYYWPEII